MKTNELWLKMAKRPFVKEQFLIYYSQYQCLVRCRRMPRWVPHPYHRQHPHQLYTTLILRNLLCPNIHTYNRKIQAVLLFSTDSSTFSTHYDVLGIDRAATQKEIKTAYIKLGKECHPDLHQNLQDDQSSEEKVVNAENDELTKKFKAINEAYEVLSKNESKRKYDLGLPGNEVVENVAREKNEKYKNYKTYDTFEERAEAMYGYKIDPDYYKKNPDKYKMAGLCVVFIVLGYIIHFTIAKLSAQKQGRWLDQNTERYNQQLELVKLNAQKRGKIEKGGDEYEKILAKLKSDQELPKFLK